MKVWKNLKKFDSSRNFRNRIFTIAKRVTLDWLKKALPFLLIEKEGGDWAEQLADEFGCVC